jgi:hypothetical protein
MASNTPQQQPSRTTPGAPKKRALSKDLSKELSDEVSKELPTATRSDSPRTNRADVKRALKFPMTVDDIKTSADLQIYLESFKHSDDWFGWLSVVDLTTIPTNKGMEAFLKYLDDKTGACMTKQSEYYAKWVEIIKPGDHCRDSYDGINPDAHKYSMWVENVLKAMVSYYGQVMKSDPLPDASMLVTFVEHMEVFIFSLCDQMEMMFHYGGLSLKKAAIGMIDNHEIRQERQRIVTMTKLIDEYKKDIDGKKVKIDLLTTSCGNHLINMEENENRIGKLHKENKTLKEKVRSLETQCKKNTSTDGIISELQKKIDILYTETQQLRKKLQTDSTKRSRTIVMTKSDLDDNSKQTINVMNAEIQQLRKKLQAVTTTNSAKAANTANSTKEIIAEVEQLRAINITLTAGMSETTENMKEVQAYTVETHENMKALETQYLNLNRAYSVLESEALSRHKSKDSEIVKLHHEVSGLKSQNKSAWNLYGTHILGLDRKVTKVMHPDFEILNICRNIWNDRKHSVGVNTDRVNFNSAPTMQPVAPQYPTVVYGSGGMQNTNGHYSTIRYYNVNNN